MQESAFFGNSQTHSGHIFVTTPLPFFKSMNDQHKFLDNKKPLSGLFIKAILS